MGPALLTAMSACQAAAAGEDVRFGRDIVPIFDRSCVACHVEGAELGQLVLFPDPWRHLVGVASSESPLKLVEPGAPERSYLLAKVEGRHLEAHGSGERMPLQQPPLGADAIGRLRAWIEAGAKQD
jgi:hypothetical protein